MSDIYFQGYRTELKPFIPENAKKILEIGCGEGGFYSNFDANVEYWGVEPNNDAYQISNQKLHKVLNGVYDDIENDLPNNYFDLIVCNDVIEHMIDHDKFLEKIKSKMTNNGQILMSISNVCYLPNLFELLIKKDWEYKDAGILDRTHLRFFTKKSLIRTLNQHNFDIVSIEGINGIKKIKSKFIRMISIAFLCVFGQSDILYLQFACLIKLK